MPFQDLEAAWPSQTCREASSFDLDSFEFVLDPSGVLSRGLGADPKIGFVNRVQDFYGDGKKRYQKSKLSEWTPRAAKASSLSQAPTCNLHPTRSSQVPCKPKPIVGQNFIGIIVYRTFPVRSRLGAFFLCIYIYICKIYIYIYI